MQIKAAAPGKLILIGEYAVLEGAPALVGAVDRVAHVTLSDSATDLYSVSAPSIEINNVSFSITPNNLVNFQGKDLNRLRKRLSFFRSTFEYAWQYCNRSCTMPRNPFHTEIDTHTFYSDELKTKLGFGSSAALTVALVKALFILSGRELNDPINQNRLFRLALAAHRKAQGNLGSGIDIAASALGGVLEYRVGLNEKAEQLMPHKLNTWNELAMLTVFSGSSESTRKMVSGVSELKKNKPAEYSKLIDNLAFVSKNGCSAYKEKNLDLFLSSIKEYHNQLQILGTKSGMPIISDVHSRIAAIVEQNGGVYKPSGAGSGDIGIAFSTSFDTLREIENILKHNNFHTIDCKIIE